MPETALRRRRLVWVMALRVVMALFCMLASIPAEAQRGPVLSGCEIDYPPFSIVDIQGRADGFSVELMRAALAAMDRAVTFKTGPWPEVRGWLETGVVQALPLVGRTPEREALFDFTFPYMSLHGAIVIRKETTGITDVDDLRGRQVAVMENDNAEEFLRREERGIEIHTTATFEEALHELSEGRYDAVVIQRLVALRLIQEGEYTNLVVVDKPVADFRQDFCFAVKTGDRDTLALLNEGLAIVMADGTYRRLHAKWFAALELPPGSRIIVGGDHDFPPFEYLDARGRPAGYAVELTRAIALAMGLDIEIRLGPWVQIMEQLEKGEIDLVQGMFYLPERDLRFDFTQPHAMHHYVGVARKGEDAPPSSLEDLAGKQLIVQQGDVIHEYLVGKGVAHQLSLVDTQEEALHALAAGNYDCAIVPRVVFLHFAKAGAWNNLVSGRRPFLALEYCYAAPAGQKALLALFSEGLHAVEASGDYRHIHDRWLGVYQAPPPRFLVALRYFALALVPLLLIIVLGALWSWSLRRQVTEKTRALRESLDRFQYIFESENVGKSLTLPSGETNVNKAFAAYLGYTQQELKNKEWQEFTHPEDMKATEEHMILLREGHANSTRFEKRYLRKDGAIVWADVSTTLRRGSKGEALYFITTVVDITAHKRAELTLRESEERFRMITETMPASVFVHGLDGQFVFVNKRACEQTGYTREELLGMTVFDMDPDSIDRDDRSHIWLTLSHGRSISLESFHRQKDGSSYPVAIFLSALFLDGKPVILALAFDMTEKKQAEAEKERLTEAIEQSGEAVIITDPEGTIQYVNRAFVALTGYTREEVLGQTPRILKSGRQSDAFYQDMWSTISGGAVFKGRMVNKRKDGSLYTEDAVISPVRNAQGAIVNYVGIKRDVTEHLRLSEQLQQAQKMESVGRLAGGVAHDFNNMLAIILGYTEQAIENVDCADPLYNDLQEVFKAAERSAAITRQLLAFARKQTIAPKRMDLNEAIAGTLKMLRRLIGEHIELAWLPETGLWPVKMDPSQLDQILANLCVNARDAIGDKGTLTIETGMTVFDEEYCVDHPGFIPGAFVLLAVSDDGSGMEQEVLDHLFEPFYTTKGVGEGTGLGFPMVYGIVKQNNGFINIYSEPGRGTTIKIYLPCYMEDAGEEGSASTDPIVRGQGETVLVVEDEVALLKMNAKMLARLGYNVLAAATPEEALQLANTDAHRIHLLMTDVVMPGMNGRDLARRLVALYPNLKTLFMSGYTANIIAHPGVLDEGVSFIHKPFSIGALAAKIHEVLQD